VLQALDQLPGGEVRADLVLCARGEVLDGGGGHGLLTCDKVLTNARVSSSLSIVKTR
jgi:hypothetical protein